MLAKFTRREALAVLAIGAAALFMDSAAALADDGVLDRLRAAGVVKVGMANQPPYSGLSPDGSVTGVAPKVVEAVMKRLGVPKVEGFLAPYGQLIPGLNAGRWDIIGASLRITSKRCAQVLYSDPYVFEGGTVAYSPAEVANPPMSIAEIGSQGLTVGILSGSYLIKKAEGLGVAAATVSQFPDNPALIDGLLAKRVQVVLSTFSSLKKLQKDRGGFEIIYPLPDDESKGSSNAFRKGDVDFHAAFQREFAALKASGELKRISADFGFVFPDALLKETAEGTCAKLD